MFFLMAKIEIQKCRNFVSFQVLQGHYLTVMFAIIYRRNRVHHFIPIFQLRKLSPRKVLQ